MTLLQSGDHVVVTDNTYGGTYRLFERVLRKVPAGLHLRGHVGPGRPARRPSSPTRRCCSWSRPPTRCCASPTSPRRRALAHARGVPVVVDNTFASPYVQRPLRARRRHGAAQHHQVPERPQRQHRRHRRGHARRPHRVAAVRAERRGRHPGPDGRVAGAARHQDAAAADGAAQRQRPADRRVSGRRTRRCALVHYPGLPSHPQHALAARQMRGFGGLVVVRDGVAGTRADRAEQRAPDGPGRKPGRRGDAHQPPGLHDARVGAGRTCGRPWASPTTWCACRWASKTSTT